MKFLFSILLFFMLIPEVSVRAIMDIDLTENTSDERSLWLEEEKEVEIIDDVAEEDFQKIAGSSGGFVLEQQAFTIQIQLLFSTKNTSTLSDEVSISKIPRYIQFCCLKLDC